MGEENVTLIVDSRGPGWASTLRTESLVLDPTSISLTYSSPRGALPLAGVSAPGMVSRIFRSSRFFWTGSVR